MAVRLLVVSEDAIAAMEPNSVIIDISIDSGGCFESSELTSHENPTYEKHGVIHYCIPNMASAVGHTATIALSNFVAPMLSTLSELGGVEDCLHYDLNMRAGLYLYKGLLTKRHLGEHFDLPFLKRCPVIWEPLIDLKIRTRHGLSQAITFLHFRNRIRHFDRFGLLR